MAEDVAVATGQGENPTQHAVAEGHPEPGTGQTMKTPIAFDVHKVAGYGPGGEPVPYGNEAQRAEAKATREIMNKGVNLEKLKEAQLPPHQVQNEKQVAKEQKESAKADRQPV